MSKTYTLKEICESKTLWGEYIDTTGLANQGESNLCFDSMDFDERLEFVEACGFADEPTKASDEGFNEVKNL